MTRNRLNQVLSQLLQITQSQHWKIKPHGGAINKANCLLDFQQQHLGIDDFRREIFEAALVKS
jgi:hypothetical protein